MRLMNGVRFPLDGPCPVNVLRLDESAVPMVMAINRNGLRVDVQRFRSLSEEVSAMIAKKQAELNRIAKREINVNSHHQVLDFLGGDLRLPVGRSTSEEKLREVMALAPEPVRLVIEIRHLRKLISAYVEKMPLMAGPDGRIRTRINPVGTRTGRYSSESPNLQNVPLRTEVGRKIRSCFVASDGCALVSHDLRQIEMRLAAHLSGDPRLISLIAGGDDVHVHTASVLFGVPLDKVDPVKHRLPAKTLGFAVLYGVTPSGLRIQILSAGGPDWSVPECLKFIERWFSHYSGVARWLDEQRSRARRLGLLWDEFGRHRYIPGVRSAIDRIREKSYREAGNFPIQSEAAGIIKVAMWGMYQLSQFYESAGKVCRPCLQIHDELLHEVSEDIAEEFSEAGRMLISDAVPLRVPLESSSSVAKDWGSLK